MSITNNLRPCGGILERDTMSEELKPCAHCGSGPARPFGSGPGQASFSGVELVSPGKSYYHVWCGTCGAQGPTEATEAEAIEAWNRRAPDLADAAGNLLHVLSNPECGGVDRRLAMRDLSAALGGAA